MTLSKEARKKYEQKTDRKEYKNEWKKQMREKKRVTGAISTTKERLQSKDRSRRYRENKKKKMAAAAALLDLFAPSPEGSQEPEDRSNPDDDAAEATAETEKSTVDDDEKESADKSSEVSTTFHLDPALLNLPPPTTNILIEPSEFVELSPPEMPQHSDMEPILA
ncbi:hypothetical protein SAICODRAFT_70909 [Saitoella complicata NRRL Y-17804]|uniref:uncharacterized protein n=1 Tax=Saitoella complicata (strain BCRC 22490 / CBS 7301 / JCM 7358 / NBRC 10748 / NRRL Y-17804) TaxID=698492 RepID=UPI00086742A3|nr:uncharacterized protein SAICODRAFT_70909 [Saitoella complicata NRRL Y-17804]ODQ53311.1 hypothetical protein SAICODRAFT_70909 [Saitoella complicata NRRL Y-17804]